MGGLSPLHLLLVILVALLVLGPSRLPDTAAALGKSVREFRRALEGEPEPTAPAPSAAEADVEE